MVPGTSATGEYRLYPDFTSLRYGPREGHVSAWGEFREQNGDLVHLCPRTLLKRAVAEAARRGLSFLFGFEIELLVMYRDIEKDRQSFLPVNNDGHAWSVARAMESQVASKVIERSIAVLARMGIHVEQFHPESAPGQYEVVLPRAPPLEAVETLLHARDVISNIATSEGWRVTLHPKPFPTACGTAAHVHMSVASPEGSRPEVYGPFYAGVLKHLRAIAAITYSNPASYDRVRDSCWAGGRWVAWGTQNRETALRKIEGSHWELKCNDGLSNPYLALAAVIFAGTKGVADGVTLRMGDCEVDPASLTENDRAELCVREMLPASLPEALEALRRDEELGVMLGEEFVEQYVTVKTAEMAFLANMEEEERRQWIMERY
jgi:glutamine synthetase